MKTWVDLKNTLLVTPRQYAELMESLKELSILCKCGKRMFSTENKILQDRLAEMKGIDATKPFCSDCDSYKGG